MDFDDFEDLEKDYSAVIYVKPEKKQVVVKFFGFNDLQEADVFAKYMAIDLGIQQLIPANRTLN
jgi:hypothetical protein